MKQLCTHVVPISKQKKKVVGEGIKTYKLWQETEETASGYILWWWGRNGKMRDKRGYFLMLNHENVFIIQTDFKRLQTMIKINSNTMKKFISSR